MQRIRFPKEKLSVIKDELYGVFFVHDDGDITLLTEPNGAVKVFTSPSAALNTARKAMKQYGMYTGLAIFKGVV